MGDAMGERADRVVVLGLGNVLMGDDALGPHVIEALLAGYRFDDRVTVMDAGTPGLDLAPFVMDADALVLVDTVRSDGPPGTIRRYREGEILKHAPQPRLSPHDPSLKEVLLACRFHGSGPREVLLVGVIPEGTATGVGLSAAVRDAIPAAVGEVLAELERLEVPASPRPGALPAAPWWEKPVEAALP
jgi:hydrogenase maturation protease